MSEDKPLIKTLDWVSEENVEERPIKSVCVEDGVFKYVYTDTGEDVV